MTDRLISLQEAASMLSMSKRQLRLMDNNGTLQAVKTDGGHRRYRLSDINTRMGVEESPSNKESVAVYTRVSSHEQKTKGDLDRQKARLLQYCAEKKYQVDYIYDEVGSGMNDTRSKLHQLLGVIFSRKINKVIIEHKDRLSRFNFNIFKVFLESYGVTIEYVEETLPKAFEAELVEDMLSLMASFSAKIYGKRSAENRKKLNNVGCK
jgi:predicted site-specific integrase-resolvase